MSKNYRKAAERLNLFLADTEGESLDEVTRELRAAGVNVEGFVTDIKRIAGVRSGFSRAGRFANKTREEILKLLEECQAGFSSGLSQAGLAAREGGLDQLSDEQLQSLLEKLDSDRSRDSKTEQLPLLAETAHMNPWRPKRNGLTGPTWSASRDQQLHTCERKYYFQYLAGARVNSADPMQKRLGILKKLKCIRMWEGDCLHWAISRFLGAIRDQRSLSVEQILAELKCKVESEWLFSEQKRFRTQPMLIEKGGLGLVEHEYDSVPEGVTANVIYQGATTAFQRFVNWAEGDSGVCDKIRLADNLWIEPPVFGVEAPGFILDGVQIIAKVDLAIEKSRAFFEIYDWKTGDAPVQKGSYISQNELQVCVYQLWPHLSMHLPLGLVSSHLVYLGGETPEVRTHRLDEQSAPLVLQMVRNSVALAGRWEKNFESGQLRLEDLDYAGWLGFCRDCAFKGVCRESLQYENVA